jgi:hypothetical protein
MTGKVVWQGIPRYWSALRGCSQVWQIRLTQPRENSCKR